MNVIVDTSIWSLAFRRNNPVDDSYIQTFQNLILDGRVAMLGSIRQEVLSGIKHQAQFDRLKKSLRAFPNIDVKAEEHELAAEYFNLCRSKGVQGANTDFLICSVAVTRNFEILTTDKDFVHFAKLIPINLYELGAGS